MCKQRDASVWLEKLGHLRRRGGMALMLTHPDYASDPRIRGGYEAVLDAIVDEHGRIQSVKVLRGHPLLARAATQAVEQWEYEPLKLNGSPTAFELTVSLWFHFDDKAKKRS